MAKAASLASQAGVLAPADLKLPAVFSAPAEPVQARYIAPYISFAHPNKSDEWKKLNDKFGAVEEGQMFLMEKEGPTRLNPAKLSLFCCKQFWAKGNAAGEILQISWKELPDPFKEHVECVVLVYLEDRIVPANIEFRTTKCGAAKALSDALLEAQTAAWGDRSPAHKETLVCNQPFMRFYGDVSLGEKRTSRRTGLPYRPTQTNIKPTGAAEWRLLKDFFEKEGTQKAIDDAAMRFESRIAEMKQKAIAA